MTAHEYRGTIEGYLKPSYLPGAIVILPPYAYGTAVTVPAPAVSDLTCLSCGGTEVATNHECTSRGDL